MQRSTERTSAGASIYAALMVRQVKDWVVWDALCSPVLAGEYAESLEQIISSHSPVPITAHKRLSPDENSRASIKIYQASQPDDSSPLCVADVSVVETFDSTPGAACVDLFVTATSDGTLSFSARDLSLNINLHLQVDEPKREQTVTFDV